MRFGRTLLRAGFLTALGTKLLFAGQARSQVITPLTSPEQMSSGRTTIHFDGLPHLTSAQNLYFPLGVQFTRDDAFSPLLYDVSALFQTTSPPNVLSTVGTQSYIHSTYINSLFANPTYEIGAFFGNDQVGSGTFVSQTLTVYDALGTQFGSVTVPSNNNSSVDQFIGLRSSVPFARARFNNDGGNGSLAVGLDDFAFTIVPEPSALALVGLVAVCAAVCRRGQAGGGDASAACGYSLEQPKSAI